MSASAEIWQARRDVREALVRLQAIECVLLTAARSLISGLVCLLIGMLLGHLFFGQTVSR